MITGLSRYLVEEAKANTEIEDDAGNTPINDAARMGNLKCFELLCNKQSNIEHSNKHGVSRLLFSCIYIYIRISICPSKKICAYGDSLVVLAPNKRFGVIKTL